MFFGKKKPDPKRMDRFPFWSKKVRGEFFEDFFYYWTTDSNSGTPEKYAFMEFPFPAAKWRAEQFDAFCAVAEKCALYPVGYRAEETEDGKSERVRIASLLINGTRIKRKGRLRRFFAERGIAAEISFVFGDRTADIMPKIFPYPYVNRGEADVRAPFDRDRVAFLDSLFTWRDRSSLSWCSGVRPPSFFVAFPKDTPAEKLKSFAADGEKAGFACRAVSSAEGLERRDGQDNALGFGLCGDPWDEPVKEEDRSTGVLFEKPISFVGPISAERLAAATILVPYREVYYLSDKAYMEGAVRLGIEEMQVRIDWAEKIVRVALTAAGATPLPFCADDFRRAGLTWLADSGKWVMKEPNEGTRKALELFARLSFARPLSGYSGKLLTDAVETLYAAAKEAGALRLQWR